MQAADQLLDVKAFLVSVKYWVHRQRLKGRGEPLTLCNDMSVCTCTKQDVKSAFLRVPLRITLQLRGIPLLTN